MTGFKAVNRQCASSLQSVTDIATSIQAGMIDIGVAAGVEHMTRDYGVSTHIQSDYPLMPRPAADLVLSAPFRRRARSR